MMFTPLSPILYTKTVPISTGVFTEDSMWGIFGYGFAASLFAGLVTIPRLVCAAVGVAPVDNHEFSFVYLAVMLFVLSYIVASLGIGFKDGLKNIKTISEVEDIYRPYKQKKRTRATIAKEKGLEPLAALIMLQKLEMPLEKAAESYVSPEKEVANVQEAIAGAKDIIAEHISDGDDLYLALRHIGMTDDEIKYEGFELYDNCDE